MEKVRNIDLFLLVWCTIFAIYEGYCMRNGIGTFGMHLFAFAIQISILCLTVKNIIVSLQQK